MGKPTLILDNGAYTAKVGFSNATEPRVIPNCIMKAKSERRRPFIGDQISECRDASGLFYILPFQKGYLLNWEAERNIWEYIFSKDCCPVNFSESCLVITEPYFNFASIQEAMTEILFEEYECSSLLRINAGDLAVYRYLKDNPGEMCCLLVDVGYSFSHIVPYIKGKKVKAGIRRIDIGGKALTNHLKDIISYRHLNVMEETYVMNQVKEDACFISQDFNRDMNEARGLLGKNSIVRDYILPDYTTIRRGYLRQPEEAKEESIQQQSLRLNNERFAVPETLFRPSDIGVNQMGLVEAAVHSIFHTSAIPQESQPHFTKNVLLVGGSTLFPGFHSRFEMEFRSMVPSEQDVRVVLPKDPITYAWSGGALLAQDPKFHSMVVTREDFEEEGHQLCYDRFDV
ncbi:actin-related protein 6 [Hetaerina americana]|uniref:actin-related protein 6 n=1 Tax=Hetaerina americana TaxID=62018 RepID=UPI003A7F3BDE